MRVALALSSLLFVTSVTAAEPSRRTHIETPTCQASEESAFSFWRWIAGDPELSDSEASERRIAKLAITTSDERTLRGFHMQARGQSKGAILVIQGNAWAAVDLLDHLTDFQSAGFDVYIFDFRGYAQSKPGNPTIRALLSDYVTIFDYLHALSPRRLHVYAFSFGGIIAMNSLAGKAGWDTLVIDSTPSRVPSAFKCPATLDPVAHVPSDARGILMINGGKDRKVKSADMQELIARSVANGAAAWRPPEWRHPFEGRRASRARERQTRLVAFLSMR